MTTTERFTTHCPSCDAGVAVKAALVGKKIECPKCKFRFVVPDAPAASPAANGKAKPAADKATKAAAADTADEKADPKAKGKGKKGKAKEKKAGGGNGKVIIGAVAGVLALVGLVIGAVLIFGKLGGDNKTAANTTKPVATTPGGPGGPVNPGNPLPDGELPGPGGPGGGGQPGDPSNPKPDPKPKPPTTPSGVDITNLLPGDAQTVLHVRMDDLAKNAPGLRAAVFDKTTAELFERSMHFKHTDIGELVQCEVGAGRDPFLVMRTKTDLDEGDFAQPKMNTSVPDNATIQGRQYRLVNSNAFLTAAERSLGVTSFFGLNIAPTAADAPKGKEIKYAICLYDARTLIIAEHNLMQRFLSDLKDGYPEFKTEYKGPETPPKTTEPGKPDGGPPSGPPTGPPGGGGGGPTYGPPGGQGGGGGGGPTYGPPPGGGGSSSGPPGGIPPQQPGGGGGPPGGGGLTPITPGTGGTPVGPPGGGPGGPGGGTPTPPKPTKSITSNPSFRTIEPVLKKALNAMEDEEKGMPAVVYVERLNQALLNSLDLETLINNPDLLAAFTLLSKVKVLGASVTRVTDKRGSLSAYIEYSSDDDAKSSVTQHVMPLLQILALQSPAKLGAIQVTNLNETGGTPGGNGGGTPGYPGSGSGGPTYPPGGGGGYTPPGGPGGGVPGPVTPGTGGGGPGGGKEPGPEASAPKSKPGGGDENAQGPRPGGPPGPITPGTGGSGNPGTEGPTYPGSGGGYPGSGYPGGGTNPGGKPVDPTGNRIEVYRDGATVTITAEFNWKEDAFAALIEPLIARQGSLVRGKMGMYSGESGLLALAARTVDGKPTGGLPEKAFAAGQLPPGALERDANRDDRKLPGSAKGLPYPPEQRCSFYAELIKYMDNKGGVYRKIDSKKAWYQGENLSAAEAWIPELLAPDYPQTAWRATSELVADGRSVGATNYVGVAGLGLDAARYDPKNPDQAKKAGMFGYDWGTKPEEVTDGLSNTMYLIQVPPTYQRPWMAGGGATVMGVDDKGTDPAKPFMVKRSDGTRGTMVLMGDGSVRQVKEGIDPKVFRAMATRAGGEKIDDFDKVVPVVPPGVDVNAGK